MSSRDRGDRNEGKIYVGNLPANVRQSEVEDLFYKYGRIVDISLKGGNGSSFAFVTFEDGRDAQDAVRGRHGVDFDGARLRNQFARNLTVHRVERSHGGKSSDRSGRPTFTGQHSKYRVVVSGLPRTGSWQDLKDFGREAGDVLYTSVSSNGDGTGVIEFAKESHLEWALKNLDGKKFRSHMDDSSVVTLKEDRAESPASNRSRSPRRRSRSPRRSPRRSESPRRRSPSPRRRSPSPRRRSPSPRRRSPSPRKSP